jgi:hypothetical protein
VFLCCSRIPEDDTPVPEHVGVDTHHELYIMICILLYRVIRKSLRGFRPLRYGSRDGHAEGEHVNRVRGTASFCPTLQVLDMCTLGDATDVKFWQIPRHRPLTYSLSTPCFVTIALLAVKPASTPRRLVQEKKLGEILCLLICSFLPCLSVCLGCCAVEFGNPGGTYESPCIITTTMPVGSRPADRQLRSKIST